MQKISLCLAWVFGVWCLPGCTAALYHKSVSLVRDVYGDYCDQNVPSNCMERFDVSVSPNSTELVCVCHWLHQRGQHHTRSNISNTRCCIQFTGRLSHSHAIHIRIPKGPDNVASVRTAQAPSVTQVLPTSILMQPQLRSHSALDPVNPALPPSPAPVRSSQLLLCSRLLTRS